MSGGGWLSWAPSWPWSAKKEDSSEHFDIDAQDDYDRTRLIWAAIQSNVEDLKECVKEGALVNLEAYDRKTALHEAASRGPVESVQVLLKAGADIEAKDSHKNTPFMEAVQNGQVNIIKVLLGAGASMQTQDDMGNTPLHVAAFSGNVNVLQTLLNVGGASQLLTTKDRLDENTPLHAAVRNGNAKVIEALINAHRKFNVDMTTRDKMGRTAGQLATDPKSRYPNSIGNIFRNLLRRYPELRAFVGDLHM